MTQIAVIHSAFEDFPRTVAFVEVGNVDLMRVNEALEYAYTKTNNIYGSWSLGSELVRNDKRISNLDFSEDVTVVAELPVSKLTGNTMGIRSTYLGDQMLLDGKKYVVTMAGFEEVI